MAQFCTNRCHTPIRPCGGTTHNLDFYQEDKEKKMAITFPFLWQVNANGSVSGLPGNQTTGNMNLTFTGSPTADDSFVFTGQLELAGETTNISGSYDGVGKMITFTRLLDTGSTQTYVGFLGDSNVKANGPPDRVVHGPTCEVYADLNGQVFLQITLAKPAWKKCLWQPFILQKCKWFIQAS